MEYLYHESCCSAVANFQIQRCSGTQGQNLTSRLCLCMAHLEEEPHKIQQAGKSSLERAARTSCLVMKQNALEAV